MLFSVVKAKPSISINGFQQCIHVFRSGCIST